MHIRTLRDNSGNRYLPFFLEILTSRGWRWVLMLSGFFSRASLVSQMRNHRGEVVVWMVKDSISKSKSGSRLGI